MRVFNRIKPTEVETLVKPEAAFNSALTRFKAADAEVAKLALKLEEANSQREQAVAASTSAESSVASAITGKDFDFTSAGELGRKQRDASVAVEIIDRALDQLKTELAGAKVDVMLAERDCVIAQAAYHDSLLDESTHKWLRANAKPLQSLCQQLHMATIFQRIQHDGPQPDYPPTHVENLFLLVLPRLVSNEFSDDESFRAGCQATLAGAPLNKLVLSPNITNSERQVTARLHGRDQQIAALRKSLSNNDESMEDFNRYDIEIALTNQRSRAEAIRSRVTELEAQIEQAEQRMATRKDLQSQLALEQHKKNLKQTRAELERTDGVVSGLQQRLLKHAA